MLSHEKPYSIFKRNRIYYSQFKLPDGRWGTAKSTGKTLKGRAERWVLEYLTAWQVVRKENVTLAEFSKDFFSWEGSWATGKRVRGIRKRVKRVIWNSISAVGEPLTIMLFSNVSYFRLFLDIYSLRILGIIYIIDPKQNIEKS